MKGENSLPLEATQTAYFLLFMDKLFDSCNAHSKVAPVSKPLKGALTLKSPHEQFWLQAIELVKTMKFYCERKQKYVIVPSLKNLMFSLRGFIHIKNKLLKKFTKSYICLRDLNQDCLEFFFHL